MGRLDVTKLTAQERLVYSACSTRQLKKMGFTDEDIQKLRNGLTGNLENEGSYPSYEDYKEAYSRANAEAKALKQQYKDNASTAFKNGEYSDWLKHTWKYACAPNGAFQEAKSPLVALWPYAAALFVTSCSDWLKPDDALLYDKDGNKVPVNTGDKKPASPTIYNIVNININVSVVNTGMDAKDFLAIFEAAMKQVIAQIDKSGKDIQSEMGNITASLIAYFNSIGLGSLSAIKELLEKISADNEQANGILEEINKKLDGIKDDCQAMINQGSKINEIVTILENEGKALIDIINALQACDKTLGEIVKALLDNGKSLDTIIGLLTENGYSLAEIKELLIKSNLNEAEIIAGINTLIQGQKGLTTELKTAVSTFASFMEKGLKLDAETQKVVYAIFDLIAKLGDNNGGASVDTAKIEGLITKLLDLVANLPTKDDVTQLNDDNKKLLNGIYDLINKFMAQEKAMDEGEKALGNKILDVVTAMNAKLDKLPAAITEPLLAKLNEILDKIPEGCEGCDVTVLISRLDTIIEKLEKDDPSNEGIVDDLDNLLK